MAGSLHAHPVSRRLRRRRPGQPTTAARRTPRLRASCLPKAGMGRVFRQAAVSRQHACALHVHACGDSGSTGGNARHLPARRMQAGCAPTTACFSTRPAGSSRLLAASAAAAAGRVPPAAVGRAPLRAAARGTPAAPPAWRGRHRECRPADPQAAAGRSREAAARAVGPCSLRERAVRRTPRARGREARHPGSRRRPAAARRRRQQQAAGQPGRHSRPRAERRTERAPAAGSPSRERRGQPGARPSPVRCPSRAAGRSRERRRAQGHRRAAQLEQAERQAATQ